MASNVIKVCKEIEGEISFTRDCRFRKTGEIPVTSDGRFKYDLNKLPTRPLVVCSQYEVIFVAHESGFCVAKIRDVLKSARNFEKGLEASCIQDISVADVPVGQVSILAFSVDKKAKLNVLAACVGHQIHLFLISLLLDQGAGPASLARPLTFSSCIKDMEFRPKWAEYVVLTTDGRLYLGVVGHHCEDNFYSFQENVDCVCWSDNGKYLAVATDGLIIILNPEKQEKCRITLLFDTLADKKDDSIIQVCWSDNGKYLAVATDGLIIILNPEKQEKCRITLLFDTLADKKDDSIIQVDSIRWVRPDCIMIGCYSLCPDGNEKNHVIQLISVKKGKIKNANANPVALNFPNVFHAVNEDIPSGSGPYTIFSYLQNLEIAFVANRRSTDQHIVLFGWSSNKENGAEVLNIASDDWLPAINLQANTDDDNMILGLDIIKLGKPVIQKLLCGEKLREVPCCCMLLCVTVDGRLSIFHFASSLKEEAMPGQSKVRPRRPRRLRHRQKSWSPVAPIAPAEPVGCGSSSLRFRSRRITCFELYSRTEAFNKSSPSKPITMSEMYKRLTRNSTSKGLLFPDATGSTAASSSKVPSLCLRRSRRRKRHRIRRLRPAAPFLKAAASCQMRTCRYCGKNGDCYPILNHEIRCKDETIVKAAIQRAVDEEIHLEFLADAEFYINIKKNRQEKWAMRAKEFEKKYAVCKETQIILDAQRKANYLKDAEETEATSGSSWASTSEYFSSEGECNSSEGECSSSEGEYNSSEGEYYSSDEESSEPEELDHATLSHFAWMDSEHDAAGQDSHCDYDLPAVCQELQANFTVLKEEDIKCRQKDDVSQTSILLSISKGSAFMLLHHYSWSVINAVEAWYNNEAEVRRSVGVLEKPYSDCSKTKNILCQICLNEFLTDKTTAAPCGHHFCNKCWKGYIQNSIDNGPECLTLGCAIPSCRVALGVDFIRMMARYEEKKKFEQFMLRSYIEGNPKMKWCPARDCSCAIAFDYLSEIHEVTCHCAHRFCWNCNVEAHRPVDCEIVSKWLRNKDSAEAHSLYWITLNSKLCPQCNKPIEKDQGCVHMKCKPPCNYEFCWLCLGPWSDHGPESGGFFSCNRFDALKRAGLHDQNTKPKIERAANEVKRYNHHYERWATNQTAQEKALADMHEMQNVHLPKLCEKHCQTVSQLDFIIKAFEQIVHCRRILKWTYAYAYYLCQKQTTKTALFYFLQGLAEAALERLHYCGELEIQAYISGNTTVSQEVFTAFRNKLTHLTSVTGKFFENLVSALENNLEEAADWDLKSVKTANDSEKKQTCKKIKRKMRGSVKPTRY